MAALAYLFPPLSGLFAYLKGSDERTRAHGIQAVAFGALWPLSLYGASTFGSSATRVAFFGGALIWLVLLASTALGADLVVPAFRKLAKPAGR